MLYSLTAHTVGEYHTRKTHISSARCRYVNMPSRAYALFPHHEKKHMCQAPPDYLPKIIDEPQRADKILQTKE